MWRAGNRTLRRDRGFTLVEAVVAVAVLAMAAAVVAPRVRSSLGTQAARADALALASFVAAARAQAMAARIETVVTFDTLENRYWSSYSPDVGGFGAEAKMQVTVASSERVDRSRGSVRFFADGTATGAHIEVATGRVAASIRVDWLTGRVDVDFVR